MFLTPGFATLTHTVATTVVLLLLCCKLWDNCSVQRHDKCTEPEIMESTFSWELQQYFCVADIRKNCFWFWSFQVRTVHISMMLQSFSCMLPQQLLQGRKGRTIPVAFRMWFPQVIHVTFPPQLLTCFLFSLLSHPVSFPWQLRHIVILKGFPLCSALFYYL